jgi:hypothetical protein
MIRQLNRAREQAFYRANLKYQAGELANEDFEEAARLLREIDRRKGELKSEQQQLRRATHSQARRNLG